MVAISDCDSGENTCSVTYLGKTLTCDRTQH